jgi:uncharacterized membrane protein
MGPDEQPTHTNQESQVAAELAALSARVEALEHELAQLRPQPTPRAHQPAPPPPRLPLAPNAAATPDATAHLPRPASSLEDRIGAQLFSRIGIVALLIATTLFLKWAIDNHYIGNTGRIAAGLIAGAAIVLWSERFRRNGFNAFSYSLKAIGSGALYLSLWAAFQLYHLLPAGVALAAMILVTAWNAFMAWSQNSEVLAAYALAGAFATPLLLSTGGDHEVFLFTYILAIDIATVALVRLKPWPRLLLGAFPLTVAFFIAWYVNWYGAFGTTSQPLATTTIFIALFFLTFILPSIHEKPAQSASASMADRAVRAARPDVVAGSENALTDILLPLANAAFAALSLYSVLQDAGHHDVLPWIAVLLAAIYLGLMRLRQSPATAAIHLSLAVVFLTIAIPLKASGRWITIGWLAEGAALLWVASRLIPPATTEPLNRVPHLRRGLIAAKVGNRESDPFSHPSSIPSTVPSAPNADRTLRRLAAAALTLGFLSLLLQPYFENFPANLRPYLHETAFLNAHFATSLFGLAAFAAAAWIALHAPRRHEESKESEESDDSNQSDHESNPESLPSWLEIAAASIIAFNLAAILSVVRELELLWYNPTIYNPEADLQKSLAISAFLMLYGAALLAAGFWKRSAFIRWQALILLVFTIAKTFLYDLRNLSQGYRVLSFLGLGALLMAISFVYQKDLLSLRNPEPVPAPPPPSPEEAKP